jgi:hypothetical protein
VAIYDGWYVALAEALDLPLATLDGRLAKGRWAQVPIPRAGLEQVDMGWFEIHTGPGKAGLSAGYRTGYRLGPRTDKVRTYKP